MKKKLVVKKDTEFKNLIEKTIIPESEMESFIKRLKTEKHLRTFHLWKGKGVLLNKYAEYDLCLKNNITPIFEYHKLATRQEAREWIGDNQMQSPNLNNWNKGVLGLKIWRNKFEKDAEANKKLSNGRGKKGRRKTDKPFERITVNQRLGCKTGLSSDTIGKIKSIIDFAYSKVKDISEIIKKLEKGEISVAQGYNEVKRIKRRRNPPKPGTFTNDLSKGIENSVICMDILKGLKLVPDNSVSVTFTSPPFGVDMKYADGVFDRMPWKQYLKWLREVFEAVYPKLRRGGKVVIEIEEVLTRESKDKKIEIRRPTIGELQFIMRDIGYIYLGNTIWDKGRVGNNFGPWKSCGYPSDADLKPMHSNLLVWCKEQKKLPCITGEYSELTAKEFRDLEKTVWRVVPTKRHKTKHVCPFPIELAEKVVRFWSHKNDLVLDIFGGSGSTAMACVRNQRKFIHIDASKTYCQEAQKSINKEIRKFETEKAKIAA